VIKRKVKIPYDRHATSTPVCQLTTPTLKISLTTIEVSDAHRGSVGSLIIGRKPVPTNRPSYRRAEGGFEEFNISAESE
jgi:hypothetical protein